MVSLATRRLPRTGQALSLLGLGCAPLAGRIDPVGGAQARATIDAAWAVGCRLFDTAPYYGLGLSEHRLGEALRDRRRAEWMISTKVGRLLRPRPFGAEAHAPAGSNWAAPLPFAPVFDYTAAGVRRSIEDSLQRLGTNRVDIALVHDVGEATHGAAHESQWQALTAGGGLRELEALKREGLVGAFGLAVEEMPVVLRALDQAEFDCCLLSGRYTLLEQDTLPLLDACAARQVGVIIGRPFNAGILAGRDRAPPSAEPSVPAVARQRLESLARVCAAHAASVAAVALQFPLAHPAVVSCVPGARSAQEVSEINRWLAQPLRASLWSDLKAEGLLRADAPVPA